METLRPSRTRRKKADHARKALGESLAALGSEQLAAIDMPTELREALQLAARTRAHGARRRQLQFIGALLRRMDVAPLRQALENIQRGDTEKAMAFKRIEAWRDALRRGQFECIEEILARCPAADRQPLTQLARSACREFGEGRGTTASRKLFIYLRGVIPSN
jgi:ribosome-associated protein